jgi:hypothetical protein
MRYLVLAAVVAALLGTAASARADGGTVVNLPTVDSLVASTEIVVTDEPSTEPIGTMPAIDPETGVAYPSGCRQVDVAAVEKSFLFKTVVYRFHQIKHWCWHNGVVYDERHAWSFDGSSTACLDTVYAPNAWFFAWQGKSAGGHFSEEHAHVTNCVFKIGNWSQLYPDVKIWAHADGSYDQTTSN